jgi:tetratricopeptide (TPR) repeat protein
LNQLYEHTGRRVEWARLVEEIMPDFIDPATGGPIPGRDEYWRFVTSYRVGLAREARQWPGAERQQVLCVEWDRKRVRADDRNRLRTLAVSLYELGQIRSEMGRADCLTTYQESFELARRINDAGAAVVALAIGKVHFNGHHLAEAEQWYRKSLELRPEGDRIGRAGSVGELGRLAAERFREARSSGRPRAELTRYIQDALNHFHTALELTPPDAVGELTKIHNNIGAALQDDGQPDRGLQHYRESIRYAEAAGDLYTAAETRNNVARARPNRLLW